MIDSELVPWGKGEKQSGEDDEIDLKPYAYKESERYLYRHGVPTSWYMLQAKSARMEP